MNSENESFNISAGKSYQEVQMKERKFPWWILLLLLPLILLIPMERNLLIKFVDEEYGMPVAVTDNQILFQNIKTFGGHVDSLYTGITDEEGRADTITVHEPLWHWLFGGSGDSVYVTIDNGCAGLANAPICYNDFVKDEYKEIKLTTKKKETLLVVVDKDNREPLPNVDIEVIVFHANGEKETLSMKTDEAGQFTIPLNPICDNVNIKASREYYKDAFWERKIIDIEDGSEIELEPLKESIKVLVRDAKTRELIPGATVTLYLDGNRYGDDLTTNVNGTILAHFDDLRVNKQVRLEASKAGYKPNSLDGYTVKQFAALDEEQRTIYLDPIAKRIEFLNTDGTNKLPGVKNEITVNGTRISDEMSNANGTFSVMLVNSDIISIVSSKTGYTTNSTKVKDKKVSDLTTQDSRTIPLAKIIPPTPPDPKTCSVHFSGFLFSDHVGGCGATTIIGVVDNASEKVRNGRYPDNRTAFPKAVAHTFDGIAVYKGTHLTIYSEPNFKGRIVLDVSGPRLITNKAFAPGCEVNFNKVFSGDLEREFPRSCRVWSTEDMKPWSYGSCIITCE